MDATYTTTNYTTTLRNTYLINNNNFALWRKYLVIKPYT